MKGYIRANVKQRVVVGEMAEKLAVADVAATFAQGQIRDLEDALDMAAS